MNCTRFAYHRCMGRKLIRRVDKTNMHFHLYRANIARDNAFALHVHSLYLSLSLSLCMKKMGDLISRMCYDAAVCEWWFCDGCFFVGCELSKCLRQWWIYFARGSRRQKFSRVFTTYINMQSRVQKNSLPPPPLYTNWKFYGLLLI